MALGRLAIAQRRSAESMSTIDGERGTTIRSSSRPTVSMLMTTAGRTFLISAPTEGSKSTSQISPRLGAGAVAIQIVLGKGFKGRQFRIVPVVVLCAGGGGMKNGVLLLPRQAAQLGRSPPFV